MSILLFPSSEFTGIYSAHFGSNSIAAESDEIQSDTCGLGKEDFCFSINSFMVDQGIHGGVSSLGTDDLFSSNVGFKDMGMQIGNLILSDSIFGIQNSANSLTNNDPVKSEIFSVNSLEKDRGFQCSTNLLSDFITGSIGGVNVLSDDAVFGEQHGLNEIEETQYVFNIIHGINSLSDISTNSYTYTWSIKIDGRDVKSQIISATINLTQDSPNNSITIQSSDESLYRLCNPATNNGKNRIEITIESRTFKFMIEELDGDHRGFEVWGRSFGASRGTTHASVISVTIDDYSDTTASSVVAELLSPVSVSWSSELTDWVLPETFSESGTPFQIARRIVSTVGGIIVANDDGSVTIRRKYATRPYAVDGVVADIDLPLSLVVQPEVSTSEGGGYDSVDVFGMVAKAIAPKLEVEDGSFRPGDFVKVYAYWQGGEPKQEITTFSTSGEFQRVSGTTQVQKEEEITFQGGEASTTYPINFLNYIGWIGKNGGTVTYKENENILYATETGYLIGRVVYKSIRHTYALANTGRTVEKVVVAVTVNDESDVGASVRVQGGYKNTGDPIVDEYLTTIAGCIERGRAFIDENRYNRKTVTLETPFDSTISPGKIAYVNDGSLKYNGNFYLESVAINLVGPKVACSIEGVQWLEP